MIRTLLAAGAWLVAAAVPAPASADSVLIHRTANFKEHDGSVCVAFNAAWQALRDGDTVEIFFDQDAAYGVKQWEPGKTDLGLYPLPDRILDLPEETFGEPRDTLPANYQVYLKRLNEAGVHVTANGRRHRDDPLLRAARTHRGSAARAFGIPGVSGGHGGAGPVHPPREAAGLLPRGDLRAPLASRGPGHDVREREGPVEAEAR